MGTEGDAALDDAVDIELVRGAARAFLTACDAQDSLKDLAAMDWTGLLVEEDLGGSGWRPVEATVIAEELGRAGNSTHWLGCVTAAAALSSAPVDVRDRWLPPMLDGTGTAACALFGDVSRVARADVVDVIVTFDDNGIRLFEAAGTLPRELDDELLDVNRPVWRVELAGAESVQIGGPERAQQLLALARVLLSADSLGALSAAFERLVAYLKDRIAFGARIASFQAVQHRLVELLVFEAKARAVLTKAARALASDVPTGGVGLSAVAHAFVAAHATAAVDECMQLSGGIGFTWEYPLHHELRRVFTNGYLLGTARSSRALFAAGAGW
ncbi:acyl-CoA dehydrogenase [Mycolicibacterium elephantis]|uniref:acyl-CoA dehydrogenase family protein n=1 Tax=Mycolicibacterium elephantis TaxID=81858 RepID=UPI00062958E6|nr:acyl-CoA dehydrogenase family protein [Mycolicibacterium elephantis]KKW66133.1 acyl-CoA dehydrogenase [Mycolicibacterium elephantis]